NNRLLVLSFPSVTSASVDWCYHDPACNKATWMCAGNRQSPVDIVSVKDMRDRNLEPFSFINLDSQSALTLITNKNNAVKMTLASEVSVSRGGLPEEYKSLKFLLHWDRGASVSGSEHNVDGKCWTVQLHIVSMKEFVNDLPTAFTDSNGVAAFGVLIEADEPVSLKTHPTLFPYKDNNVTLTGGISLYDLLPGVDRTKFYRYLSSLTTPNCEESVNWTVFKDPVKVNSDLTELFATSLLVGNSTSLLIVDKYRSIQPGQTVTYSSNPQTSHSFGLIFCALVLWMR
uniref:Alpha-carbonic anhydrase domain-containing protein n=1 Tax=Periophthalmus magnuspinnatus TaxID=409849 RepID=A0A3B4BCZ4_9GOBI